MLPTDGYSKQNQLIHIFIILAGLLVTGCISNSPKISPEAMYDKGLVIARFATNRQGTLLYNGYAVINGKTYEKAVYKGHIVVQLEPGKYRLEQVGTASSSYGPSSDIRILTRTRYNLNVNFTVEPGKITNIGILMTYFKDSNGTNYSNYLIENESEARQYLKQNHPDMLRNAKVNTFLKADELYLTDKQIDALRYKMANDLPKLYYQANYAGGYLGSFYQFNKDKNGKITKVKLIKTNTYQDITQCGTDGSRYACVIPSEGYPSLYIGTDNGVVSTGVPHIEPLPTVLLTGRQGVIFVENNFHIHSSFDNGTSWQSNREFMLKKPVEYPNKIRISEGRNGFYLHSSDDDYTLVYRPYGRGHNFNKLPAANDPIGLSKIIETSSGLYTNPEFTVLSKGRLLYKKHNSQTWAERAIPFRECAKSDVVNYEKDIISVECLKVVYISQDTGLSWKQTTRSELKKLQQR